MDKALTKTKKEAVDDSYYRMPFDEAVRVAIYCPKCQILLR